MKRLVNKRPICFAALALGIGIFLTGMFEDAVWARVLFLAAALIFAGFVLIFKKARLLYIPIFFALGVLLLSGVIDVYKRTAVTSEKAEITGTISTEIASKNEHSYYFKIDDVTIDGEETGKQAFVVSGFLPNARAGDKVKIIGDVSTYDMGFRDFTSYGARGTKFYVKSRKIENVGQGVLSFDKRVLIKYKRLLYDNCDDMTSDTALALLFGDRFAIDSQYSHNVKDAGILHIFAVSGLHVGMLAAVTAFLARKLKKKKALYILIVEIPLILYGWICGFGASVLRAIVMSTVFIVSGLTGRQRDSLNSLSLAAIIVLILNPTDMFTKGFHLSFAALLGLIVIVPRLTRKELSGVKKKVRDICATSVGVNVMLLPYMVGFFGEVQTLFVISNLIILPILPFIYTISLVISLFVMILPSCAVILNALSVVLFPIRFVAQAIGSLPISSVPVQAVDMFGLAYLLTIFIMSRYVFLPRIKKMALSLVVCAVCVAMIPVIPLL